MDSIIDVILLKFVETLSVSIHIYFRLNDQEYMTINRLDDVFTDDACSTHVSCLIRYLVKSSQLQLIKYGRYSAQSVWYSFDLLAERWIERRPFRELYITYIQDELRWDNLDRGELGPLDRVGHQYVICKISAVVGLHGCKMLGNCFEEIANIEGMAEILLIGH